MEASLAEVLGVNGAIGIGLSTISEVGLPSDKRIPIPRNIGQFSGDSSTHLAALGAFAREEYLAKNPGETIAADSACLAILTGSLVLRETGGRALPQTVHELEAMNWDSEVRVCDVDLVPPKVQMSRPDLEAAIGMKPEMMAKLCTLVGAAKLTWFTTQHHLGIPLKKEAGNRRYHGFTEKVANTLQLPSIGYNSEGDTSRLYQVVHAWSTLRVVYSFFPEPQYDIREHYTIPSYNSLKGAYLDFAPSPDVTDRLGTYGAGFAALGDLVAGINIVSRSAIFTIMPGFANIRNVLEDHKAMHPKRTRYGMNASYLTSHPSGSKYSTEPYGELISGIAVWLEIFYPDSSLRRAAIYDRLLKNSYVEDEGWKLLCNALKVALHREVKVSADMVKKIVAAGNVLDRRAGLVTFTDLLIDQLPSFNADRFERFSTVIRKMSAAKYGEQEDEEHEEEEEEEEEEGDYDEEEPFAIDDDDTQPDASPRPTTSQKRAHGQDPDSSPGSIKKKSKARKDR